MTFITTRCTGFVLDCTEQEVPNNRNITGTSYNRRTPHTMALRNAADPCIAVHGNAGEYM